MPGIFSPKGVLIIGMRNELSAEQIAKLKRLNINSRPIAVLTYDDLIRKAKDLNQTFIESEVESGSNLFGHRFLIKINRSGFHFTYIAARLLSISLILSFTFFVRW